MKKRFNKKYNADEMWKQSDSHRASLYMKKSSVQLPHIEEYGNGCIRVFM